MVSKRLAFIEIKVHREGSRYFMPRSPQSRHFGCSFLLYQNKTISTFSSGEKTIAAFELSFCQLKSTNVVNKMSKVQSVPSIIVGMACG